MSPWQMIALMLPLLLLPLGHAAPKDGAMRPGPEAQQQPLPNPFQPGPEWLRLLQNYLKGLERMEEDPEHMSREQVLLYLFALHDYDQNRQLDGLELLSMFTAVLAPGAAAFPINPVVLVVDKVLETQDLDGDGLMTPAELINLPGEGPGHAEPREPPAPAPQEPQASESQPLLAKSPLRQDAQEAPGPGEEAGGHQEARAEPLESAQEAGHQAAGEGDALGPGEEARGQTEGEGDALGPGGEAERQTEARDNGEEAKEPLEEILGSQSTLQEFEVHGIQMENDEM